ncbi:MAG: GDP-mannose 4,6-dehydratase, partial [Parcubacteria group bacterium]
LSLAGIEVESNGKHGVEEKLIDKQTGKIIVEIDSNYFRPAEVDILLGDASKAKKELGWEPKTKFNALVKMMYEADFEREKTGNKSYKKYF